MRRPISRGQSHHMDHLAERKAVVEALCNQLVSTLHHSHASQATSLPNMIHPTLRGQSHHRDHLAERKAVVAEVAVEVAVAVEQLQRPSPLVLVQPRHFGCGKACSSSPFRSVHHMLPGHSDNRRVR